MKRSRVVTFGDSEEKKKRLTRFSQPTNQKKLSFNQDKLPIANYRTEILTEVANNRSVVIVGETGSGKTTQVPQYLYRAGYTHANNHYKADYKNKQSDAKSLPTRKGLICITQPRRVAATSLARRVSEEMGAEVGKLVGYAVRFEDCTSAETRIKYLTDGMLLREAMLDCDLKAYSVIILDEAHERTLHTDILFGIIRNALEKRTDLKVIIMSATLETNLFADFFQAKILKIHGRQFPVSLFYTIDHMNDYIDAAIVTIFQIHIDEAPGDILVFLTGREEIETVEQILNDRKKLIPKDALQLVVRPIFASLPSEYQQLAFEIVPEGCRKVVLATNIAETSLTVPGIAYVVDTGVVKIKQYNPRSGISSLQVVAVSKAQASQRTGRAGRERPGKCFRLYTEETFDKLVGVAIPEILRSDLATVILQMFAIGIDDIINFPYIQSPNLKSSILLYVSFCFLVQKTLEKLLALGAVDKEMMLTKIGREMAEFPLEPMYSKAIIAAEELGCVDEMIVIVSMISVETIFFTSTDKRMKRLAEDAKKRFSHPTGDHLLFLNVYIAYSANNRSFDWCKENAINYKSMSKVDNIILQLHDYCKSASLTIKYSFDDFGKRASKYDDEVIRKALCRGFFLHTVMLQLDGSFATMIDHQPVHIHPTSTLFNTKPRPTCLLYDSIILTTKPYLRICTVLETNWLALAAPGLFKNIIMR